jgi:hypothetical protein
MTVEIPFPGVWVMEPRFTRDPKNRATLTRAVTVISVEGRLVKVQENQTRAPLWIAGQVSNRVKSRYKWTYVRPAQ